MGKKYIQKPAEKPGGMILIELKEKEEEDERNEKVLCGIQRWW